MALCSDAAARRTTSPDVFTIMTWLMRLDAKVDRLELLMRGEDPDDE